MPTQSKDANTYAYIKFPHIGNKSPKNLKLKNNFSPLYAILKITPLVISFHFIKP